MEVILWGVRGSIPANSPTTQFYGTNTTCIEARLDNGELLIFDAGSGIYQLSNDLPDNGVCHLFISHGHYDHTQGLGFFKPFYKPGWTIHLYTPVWIQNVLEDFFNGYGFPLSHTDLSANIISHIVEPEALLTIPCAAPAGGEFKVEAHRANHPGNGLAYKVFADDTVFFYSGDHEITDDAEVRLQTIKMLKNTDIAIADSMYTRQDYTPGWGHSTWEDWVEVAQEAEAKILVLSHHAPTRTDSELNELSEKLNDFSQKQLEEGGFLQVRFAREGARFNAQTALKELALRSNWLAGFMEELSSFKEENVILDRILAKAREMTNSEAGTVFLEDEGELVFAYSHNDALFPVDGAHKHSYVNMRLPITESSLAGYVALTGETLNIPDVYQLPDNTPYKFNSSFDLKTGFVTRSVLIVPFLNRAKSLLGVMQLINRLDPHTNKPIPFSTAQEVMLRELAREASIILEGGVQTKNSILSLLRITSLHDPTETGPHAQRVGAVAAEVYQHWAEKRKASPEDIRYYKGQLRLAAMLHDIGKVGISDSILKKPGRLTDEEFKAIQKHTVFGAELFQRGLQDITDMAAEAALHHHQKWNGKGYPHTAGVSQMAGEKIPLSARITAIADVYDALVSPRCYKEPWSVEKACGLLREEAGQHFDPELVESFLEITDTIKMIYQRFPDIESEEDIKNSCACAGQKPSDA